MRPRRDNIIYLNYITGKIRGLTMKLKHGNERGEKWLVSGRLLHLHDRVNI